MAAKEAVRSQARPYGQIWYPPNHAKCGIVKSSSTAQHFKMKCIEWLSGDRADIKKIYQLRIHKFIFQALTSNAVALGIDLNPETNICDFETALIPPIRGYFLNALLAVLLLPFLPNST
ncbi:hypothetical protein T09_4717 [Trichinella sp. T9]|nr:hypothetical protein T09_4717 [Trichinella sp. T9]